MDAKSAMDKVQEALDNYERSLALLHTNTVDEAEINSYFTMTRDQIDKLNPLDCSEISTRLQQFGLYIQRQYNLEQSRYSWATAEITKYSSDKLEQISGYVKYENKLYLIAKTDEYMSKLLAIRDYAQTRLDRLTYLASSIKNLADCFTNCCRTKLAMREKN